MLGVRDIKAKAKSRREKNELGPFYSFVFTQFTNNNFLFEHRLYS